MDRVANIIGLLTTLVGISLIAFFVIRVAPGDPVLLLIGERGADPEQYEHMAVRLGLDAPLIQQYIVFVGRALVGDFGSSIVSSRPVLEELFVRWPATIELGVVAIVLAVIVGVPLGVFAALNQNRILDRVITVCSLIGYSMPVFWLGLLLILCFSVGLDITPVSGRLNILYDIEPVTGFMIVDTLLRRSVAEFGFDAFHSALLHMILPASTMATVPIAVFARMSRASMLEVLSEDYVRAARAKGLSTARVIWLHAFRNALIPVITVGGLFFISAAITGAILTESVFGWPGIGSYIVSSVYARDYPVIQASILVIGVLVVLTNLAIDLLYRAINPRMRG